jgi:hypothetical protein
MLKAISNSQRLISGNHIVGFVPILPTLNTRRMRTKKIDHIGLTQTRARSQENTLINAFAITSEPASRLAHSPPPHQWL